MSNFTIGFTGGYTAGHVMPMIALAMAWRRIYPNDAVLCYGSSEGIEANLVRQFDLPFQALPAHPMFGVGLAGRLRAAIGALQGALAGRRHMRRHRVDALICLGGYVSVGAGLAAASLKRPLIIFEANALPGRANSLLARFASMKLAAMPELLSLDAWRDARLAQLPLREHRALPHSPPTAGATRLLVTGGTFGSPLLNRGVPELAALLARHGVVPDIYHQSGEGHEEAVRRAYSDAGIAATVVGFDLDLPDRWSWADVALCAGGAGTLSEAATSGTPTLAMPLAAVADGHQEANAKAMAARYGIAWLPEREWDAARVAERVMELLRQPRRPAVLPSDTDAVVRAIREMVGPA